MSAEWEHKPTRDVDESGNPFCEFCSAETLGERWPCSVEKMRVERDAAIRRAEALAEAGDALNQAGGSRHAGEAGTERDQRNRRDWYEASKRWWEVRHSITHWNAPEPATLRSQESQKPPETDWRQNHEDAGGDGHTGEYASEPPETEDRT